MTVTIPPDDVPHPLLARHYTCELCLASTATRGELPAGWLHCNQGEGWRLLCAVCAGGEPTADMTEAT